MNELQKFQLALSLLQVDAQAKLPILTDEQKKALADMCYKILTSEIKIVGPKLSN